MTAHVPLPPSQHEVPAAATPSTAGLMTLAVGVVVIAALYIGRAVFIPIVLAVLLSFVLAPIVRLLRRLRLGKIPAVVLAVLVALGILISLGTLIGVQIAHLVTELPRYQTTIAGKVEGLKDGALGRMGERLGRLNRQVEEAAEEAAEAPDEVAGVPAAEGEAAEKPLLVRVQEAAATPLEIAERFLEPVVMPLFETVVILVIAIFILLQREDLRDRMIRLFGSHDLHRTTVAMDEAARRLGKFFLLQLTVNAAFGVVVGIALWFIGVPSPILWGIFAAIMRFVPYVGSLIAGALPILLAAAVDPGWSMALWTLALFAIGEPLMGHVVEPMVYGHSTGVSPTAILIAAIFWTWLWGPIGLLLSTPLTLLLVVLGRNVERLEFLDVILGDRPALTPEENFYQRTLAGDPDEALEHAELLLKERSLSSYYDEVALKGLQLAAADAQRGVLTPAQLERIRAAVEGLVGDLDGHEDIEPEPKEAEEGPASSTQAERELPKELPVAEGAVAPPRVPPEWEQPGAILCIAGRGALDEGAAAMLAQLLAKHGLGSRLAPYEAVSRSKILALDVTGVKMVCVSYLDIQGSPAHLRYLLRRLRAKLPNAPLLVGLWPAEDAILTDERLRSQIGADYYVVSLHEALKACLEAAHAAVDAAERLENAAAAPALQEAAVSRAGPAVSAALAS